MDIFLVNTSEGFKCATDEDYEKKRKLHKGGVYKCKLSFARNYQFHKKYFALINCAWEYLNEKQQFFFHDDKEHFRKTMELSCGWCEPVFNARLNEWVDCVKSIAFDKMNEEEFDHLYNAVRDIIFKILIPEISQEEFERTLRNF